MKNNKGKIYISIGLIWLWGTALGFILYVVLYPDETTISKNTECRYELHFSSNHAIWGLLVFTLAIPVGVMVVLYAAIVTIYHKHVSKSRKFDLSVC